MKNIPLILLNYNQLFYLKNSVNWFRYYYPDNPIYVIDNASNYEPLLEYYATQTDFTLISCAENECAKNLKNFLADFDAEYYCISDCDIMPHPATPPFFLEVFKQLIDNGWHHAGFDLITHDIPSWNKKADWIRGDEAAIHTVPVAIEMHGHLFSGFKAPLDTTFTCFSKRNGGWYAPMSGADWSSSVRILNAFHLPFYQHPDCVNEEMTNYYNTCKYRDLTSVSAGKNNFNPFK